MNLPISILIRTFNSAGTLSLVLDRLPLATGDEIVIVDSGSTDATLSIAAKRNARIIKMDGPFNYSRSLNLGFTAAHNSWVLVMSSHCLPQSGTLLETFRRAALKFPETVAVAYGDCSLIERKENPSEAVVFANQNSTAAHRQSVLGGNGLALYRRACWENEPFDETLPTAEDVAWFLRAIARGATAARVPAAIVLYRNQGSLSRMFHKGWLESKMERELMGKPAVTLWRLAVNLASLVKKWGTAKISIPVLLRQGAHALGAYLSAKFCGSSKTGKADQ